MENCVFCNIFNIEDRKKVDEILYEDELLFVIPAKGTPIPGWILIVTKKHINGFAELTTEEFSHVEKIIDKIKEIYYEYFNINSILLEHGSTSKGRHPQSIVHAHIHLIPFDFTSCIEKELISNLKVKPIDNFECISQNRKKDYWLYCDKFGKYYTSAQINNVPRSIFMNLVAKQIGIELPYEWRNANTSEKILDEMIEIFKKNINRLNDIK